MYNGDRIYPNVSESRAGQLPQNQEGKRRVSIPSELRHELESKRLIFTVTPGRSGSDHLSKLLHFLPGVSSHHEPPPDFASVMRSVQQDQSAAYRFWLEKKLPYIAQDKYPIYVETSHLFCKGFVEPLVELGVVPDLIILKREHRKVASSFYQIDSIPGRTINGLKYLLSPEDPGVLPLPHWNELHDYQLCFWYCLEIERRTSLYVRQFRELGGRVVSISIEDVRSFIGFYRFVKTMNLPIPTPGGLRRYVQYRNKRTNTKEQEKQSSGKDEISLEVLDSLEQEVFSLISG